MKKTVKLLTIIFIVTFLMPIASYADGIVRFNYRVAGSTTNPELGSKMLRLTLRQMDQLLRAKTSLIQAPSALFSLHYVSDYGLGFLGGGEILL